MENIGRHLPNKCFLSIIPFEKYAFVGLHTNTYYVIGKEGQYIAKIWCITFFKKVNYVFDTKYNLVFKCLPINLNMECLNKVVDLLFITWQFEKYKNKSSCFCRIFFNVSGITFNRPLICEQKDSFSEALENTILSRIGVVRALINRIFKFLCRLFYSLKYLKLLIRNSFT